MNMENIKGNEPHKIILNLSKNINTHVALQNLSIYFTWRNIRKQYKKNKLKLIAPTKNDEFGSLDGLYSVSNVQYYIEFVFKKHEKLTGIPSIHVYINRINNRLVLKIKDDYKLQL